MKLYSIFKIFCLSNIIRIKGFAENNVTIEIHSIKIQKNPNIAAEVVVPPGPDSYRDEPGTT